MEHIIYSVDEGFDELFAKVQILFVFGVLIREEKHTCVEALSPAATVGAVVIDPAL